MRKKVYFEAPSSDGRYMEAVALGTEDNYYGPYYANEIIDVAEGTDVEGMTLGQLKAIERELRLDRLRERGYRG